MSLLTKLRHSTACQLGRPYPTTTGNKAPRCSAGFWGSSRDFVSQNRGRLQAARHSPPAELRQRDGAGAADEPVPPRGPAGLPGAMSTHWSGCAPAGRRSAPCMLFHPRRPLSPPLPPPPQHGGGAEPGRGEAGKGTARPSTRAPQGTAPGGKKAPPRGTQRGAAAALRHPLCGGEWYEPLQAGRTAVERLGVVSPCGIWSWGALVAARLCQAEATFSYRCPIARFAYGERSGGHGCPAPAAACLC